jgi:flagellar protein FlbT
MALKLTIKPNERLVINGASIRFAGDRSVPIVIENHARFLRGSEIMGQDEADTPAKRILFTLQAVYMQEPDERGELNGALLRQISDFSAAVPSAGLIIAEIASALAEDRHHAAIKRARNLVAYEAELIDSARAA